VTDSPVPTITPPIVVVVAGVDTPPSVVKLFDARITSVLPADLRMIIDCAMSVSHPRQDHGTALKFTVNQACGRYQF
jgi:TRAP-type C4-dicarboxylate transport system permease large subunit